MKRQPTTQQITWFLDLASNNRLDLNPPYQRKSVWNSKDRRFFLDTIFRNYPTPPIFIDRELTDSGYHIYHVVDGKQRLETILNFAKSKIALDHAFGDTNLNGKKFRDLTTEDKRKFWDYTLVVDFIETAEQNIEEVFDRVNRNSRNLQPQELRHARYNGWFISEAEGESESIFWSIAKITSAAKDKRMKSTQLISELLLICLENKIVGFNQDYLDEMYARYDAPDETEDLQFDEDDYLDKKRFAKDYLQKMEETNKSVSTYAKTANNLYVLWATLVLTPRDRLPAPEIFAEQYLAFMEDVKKFAEAEDADLMVARATGTNTVLAYTYHSNSKGASTDSPQRSARLEALTKAIIG